MKLDAAQTQEIAGMVAKGVSLARIQAHINEAYGISMTYMEVRFLVDDLGVDLPKAPAPVAAPAGLHAQPDAVQPAHEAPASVFDPGALGGAPVGGVAVTVDSIVTPGAIVSGTVTFSDGKVGKWLIDQSGYPRLVPPEPGYRPTPEDMQQVQVKLQQALQSAGY